MAGDPHSGADESPRISLFEPTVSRDLTLSDDDITGRSQQKRSPFGGLILSDDDGEGHERTSTSMRIAASGNKPLLRDMGDSDLMNRLNKIKEAQRYDFSYSSRGVDSNKMEERNYGNGDQTSQDVTMETSQAKRLDQIQQLQKGQQVKQNTCRVPTDSPSNKLGGSDLLNRLNKIKEAQRHDFSYSSPAVDSNKTSRHRSGEKRNYGNGDKTSQDVTMETLQEKRLDQIHQTQKDSR